MAKTLNGVHVSCSTIHPYSAREFAEALARDGKKYVGAPIFARADAMAKKLCSFCVGGEDDAVEAVMPLLVANSVNKIYRFGTDPGAGNVTKLCGNFLIATTIESCAEACSLAEKYGVDRVEVMDMLSSTLFDCLIYNGYGKRVAARSHIPGQEMVGPGFQLDLGLKDVDHANDLAKKVKSPMPFASVLHDRFVAAQAKGRGKMDWSAIGLSVSEDAGIDVSAYLPPKSK